MFSLIAGITTSFCIVRQVFQYATQLLLSRTPILQPGVHNKFSESVWKLLYYLTVTIWGTYVTMFNPEKSEDIFWNTELCWTNKEVPLPPLSYYLYMIQLSFYFHAAIAHFTVETRRKDHLQMAMHHILTISLILLSYQANFTRIGLLVLHVHNFSDVMLEAGKLCNYCQMNSMGTAAFSVFVITWVVGRIVIYPMKVMYSSLIEGRPYMRQPDGEMPFYYYAGNAMLGFVQLLNVYWTVLIVKMTIRFIVTRKPLEDDREDKDD